MDDDARAQILARAQARKPQRKRRKPKTASPQAGADATEAAAAPQKKARSARSSRTRHSWDGHESTVQAGARKAVPVAGHGVNPTGDTPRPASSPTPPPLAPAQPATHPQRSDRQIRPTPQPPAEAPALSPLALPSAHTTTEGYWNDDFSVLYDFVATYGAAIPRSGQVWMDRPLGRWVEQQRRRRDRLSAAQTRALEDLPGWCWSSVEAVWEEHLRALDAWVAARGWLPPPTLRLDNGLRLGPWIEHQRRLFREGRLPEAQAERLSSVPAWTWSREG